MQSKLSHQICPSILAGDLSKAGELVSELQNAGMQILHYDIMDGQFVPPISFGPDLVKSIGIGDQIYTEAHLMTLNPENQFQPFANAGCKRIYFHTEATFHSNRLCNQLKDMGISPGIAINPGTPVVMIEPLLQHIDAVLVMTVNPGWGGQKMIESCLEKVKWIRQNAPSIDIEVDGGMNQETIIQALQAGANHFVVGSFLTGSKSIKSTFAELNAAINAISQE